MENGGKGRKREQGKSKRRRSEGCDGVGVTGRPRRHPHNDSGLGKGQCSRRRTYRGGLRSAAWSASRARTRADLGGGG